MFFLVLLYIPVHITRPFYCISVERVYSIESVEGKALTVFHKRFSSEQHKSIDVKYMNRKCVTRVGTFAVFCGVRVFWVQLNIHPIFVQLKIKTKVTNRTLLLKKATVLRIVVFHFRVMEEKKDTLL